MKLNHNEILGHKFVLVSSIAKGKRLQRKLQDKGFNASLSILHCLGDNVKVAWEELKK